MFLRVAPASEITIYVGISRKHNPYLFLYDAKEKKLVMILHMKYLKKLENLHIFMF